MDIFSFSRRFIKRTSWLLLPVDFYKQQTNTQILSQNSAVTCQSVQSHSAKEEDLLVHDVAEEQDGLDDHEDDEVERGQTGRNRREVWTLEHLLCRVLGGTQFNSEPINTPLKI